MQRSIQYGNNIILFDLILSKRKSLGITVTVDKKVVVNAPEDKSIEEITARVYKRARWIIKQLNFYKSLPRLKEERKYISGETHRYLGRQYRLKVLRGQPKSVKLSGGYIVMTLPDNENKTSKESLLKEWYRKNAKAKFKDYIEECYKEFSQYNINYPILEVKEMKTRWGSCNYNNKIILNLELIKKSSLCIKYVITHELCHLKYYNHGKPFFDLLTMIMPDWKKRKTKLEFSE